MKIGDLVQIKLGTGVYEHRKWFGEVGILLCIATSPRGSRVGMVYLMGKQRRVSMKDLEPI